MAGQEGGAVSARRACGVVLEEKMGGAMLPIIELAKEDCLGEQDSQGVKVLLKFPCFPKSLGALLNFALGWLLGCPLDI